MFYNNVFLFVGLTTLGDFKWILIGWFIKLKVKTFQPLIIIYKMGNFVYYHLGCTSIYRPVSYPLRYLIISGHNTRTSKLIFLGGGLKWGPLKIRGAGWSWDLMYFHQKKSFTTYIHFVHVNKCIDRFNYICAT